MATNFPTFFRISSFVFIRRKKCIQVFVFWVNYPFKVTEKNTTASSGWFRIINPHQFCPSFRFLTRSCDSDLINDIHFCIYHKEPQKKNKKKTGYVMIALYVPLNCLWCSMQLHVGWRLVINPKSFEERWEKVAKSC